MDYETLFNEYQRTLEWLERTSAKEDTGLAKYTAFSMYQSLRRSVENGCPSYKDIQYFKRKSRKYPPKVFDNGYECPCVGKIEYRGNTYPVYCDDYGCQDFIIVGDRHIQVNGMGGMTDWYFELDRIIDKING